MKAKSSPKPKAVTAWAMLDSKGNIRVRDIFETKLSADILAERCDPGKRIIRVEVRPL